MHPLLADHIAARNAAFLTAAVATYGDARGQQLYDEYVVATLQDRATRYTAHVAAMVIDPAIAIWAMAMTTKYGPFVKIHHFVADWVTALLVLRYGEEPDATKTWDGRGWPTAFTADDLARAQKLADGKDWPEFLVVFDKAPVPADAAALTNPEE